MAIAFAHSPADGPVLRIPEIGLELMVRVSPQAADGALSIIETVNAPGFGPPLHRHGEAEIFRVLEGRYLFEVDGQRFEAGAGDVVSVQGGAVHGFVNISDRPARQYITIVPGMDAAGFFQGLADVFRTHGADRAALNAFGAAWNVEFLGPPLKIPGDLT